MDTNPFSIPNIDKLKQTNNSFFTQNMNNNNNNNKNESPFTFGKTFDFNNLNINSNQKPNPFMIKSNPFIKTDFSKQNQNLNPKREEKDENVLIKLSTNSNIFDNKSNNNSSKDKNIFNSNSSSINTFNPFKLISNNAITSPSFPPMNNGMNPNFNFSSKNDNLNKEQNINQSNNNINKNPFINLTLNSQNKNEKKEEKEENKNILNNDTNKIKENNKVSQFEFNSSPKKQLEIIKEEDEDLKLKKNEFSSKEIVSENNLFKNFNDIEKEKEKNINNKTESSEMINIFTNKNENEQKPEKNNEKNLSFIKEEKNENEILEENNPINKVENNPINKIENNQINKIENNPINKVENNLINKIQNNQINKAENNLINKAENNPINKEENNNINNENENNIENKNEENLDKNEIKKLEDIINISSNEEEIKKIIDENINQADNLLDEYHLNIINEMIDLNVDEFKNKINQFINFSAEKINNIKLLNDICNKIKEKLLINYDIMIEKQKININEYNILKEYDEKLDYLISIQNGIIKNLKNMNEELKSNINSFKNENIPKNERINNNDLNENINNANKNINILEKELEKHFNKSAIDNLDNIVIPNFKESDNFFDVIQNIYSPLKEINKAFEQLLMKSSQLKENNNENI